MEPPGTDWIHLPNGLETRVLWHSLHDATLRSSVSDLLRRTVEQLRQRAIEQGEA